LASEIPTGKLAAADTVCAVDWVDTELHKAVVAALFPAYLQATQLLICSLEGIVLSRYAAELSHDYDALLVIGANSSQLIRHKHTTTTIGQYSVPQGYVGTATKSDKVTTDHINSDISSAYHTALFSGLDHLFPEVLVRPRILIVHEPHPAARHLAQTITGIDTQHDAIHPIWSVVPEQSTTEWVATLVGHMMY